MSDYRKFAVIQNNAVLGWFKRANDAALFARTFNYTHRSIFKAYVESAFGVDVTRETYHGSLPRESKPKANRKAKIIRYPAFRGNDT